MLGVLGMLRTTVHDSGTQSRIIEMVVPARIEMRSLPSSASDMPGWRRRCAASWGLQLRGGAGRGGRVSGSSRRRDEERAGDGPEEDDVGLLYALDVVGGLADLDEAAEDAQVGEGAAELLCRLCAVYGGDEAVRERVGVAARVEDEAAHRGRGARVVGEASSCTARGLEVVEDAREDGDAHCAAAEDAELVGHGARRARDR